MGWFESRFEMRKKIRRKQKTIYYSDEEFKLLKDLHRVSDTKLSLAAYIREMTLGSIRNPMFPYEGAIPSSPSISDTGSVDGPAELQHHYYAQVLAAQFLQIQFDPVYKKIIGSNLGAFNELTDQIRGYKYDSKTALKSPLKKPR